MLFERSSIAVPLITVTLYVTSPTLTVTLPSSMPSATIAMEPFPRSNTSMSLTVIGDTLNFAVSLLGSYLVDPSNIASTV